MKINIKRLQSSMDAINSISITPDGGVSRLALSDADKKARDMLKQWMMEAGLDVRIDDVGNIYGFRSGLNNNSHPICLGSHLDTQPNGGKFDGTLGVMGALEVIRTLNDNKVQTQHPFKIINWTNEEGARFKPALMGSGVIGGAFDEQWVYNIKDADGKRFIDELKRIGYFGQRANRLTAAKAYLELHIEQGPVLDKADCPVGIVQGISGSSWYKVTIKGTANHAGACPMTMREDALVSAARAIVEIRESAMSQSNSAVVTVGEIRVSPGTINIIPEKAVFTIDLRCPDEKVLVRLEEDIMMILKDTCRAEQTILDVERIWYSSPVTFSDGIVAELERSSKALGVPTLKLISGANHDAKSMLQLAPTGMIFVKSIDGKSHCPEELSKWDDIEAAANLLLKAALNLSE